MNVAAFMVVGTAVAVLLTALLAGRARGRRGGGLEEWSLGGRGFGSALVFLLMAGEIYTTVTFLGVSGYAYDLGGAAVYLLAYACLAYVVSYWLLPPVWRYARRHRVVSVVELYGRLYESRAVAVVVGAVAVAALVPYLAGQLKGLGVIVTETTGHLVGPTAAVCGGAVVLCLYVVASGIRGSAWTAVVKDLLILTVVVFLGTYIPLHYFGGTQEMFRRIAATHPGHLTLSENGLSPTWFSTTVLLTALGFFMWPHTMGAALTAKDARTFRVNAVVSPLYCLLLLLVLLVGFAALVELPGLSSGQSDLALLRIAARTFPDWMVGVIGAAGVLTALVPGSVIVIAMASTLVTALRRPGKGPASSERTGRAARRVVPLVVLAGLLLALNGSDTVVTLLLLGYALVAQLLPALVGGLLPGRPVTVAGALAGTLSGVLLVAALSITTTAVSASSALGAAFPAVRPPWSGVNLGLAALAVNIVVTTVTSALTRPRTRRPHTSRPPALPPAGLSRPR